MALGGKVLDLMFDLYGKGFFKEINSVIDMGDQDVNATFNEIQNKFIILNIISIHIKPYCKYLYIFVYRIHSQQQSRYSI